MAGAKKPTQADAKLAAAQYREALVDDSMDQLVGELAVKMGEWRNARDHRVAELIRLEMAEQEAEEAVVAAFEAARSAGAKVRALEKIDLKPSEAIAAVNKRAKTTGTGRRSAAAEPADSPDSDGRSNASPVPAPAPKASVPEPVG